MTDKELSLGAILLAVTAIIFQVAVCCKPDKFLKKDPRYVGAPVAAVVDSNSQTKPGSNTPNQQQPQNTPNQQQPQNTPNQQQPQNTPNQQQTQNTPNQQQTQQPQIQAATSVPGPGAQPIVSST